jgi:hypothetical protein
LIFSAKRARKKTWSQDPPVFVKFPPEHYILNQLKANQNKPKQNQSCGHLKEKVEEDGYVKNGSFLHRPLIK